MKKVTSHRGFTVLELLVVIGIITLLAAIMYSTFFVARKRSKDTVCISQLRQIGQALRMYATDYDDYPRYNDFFPRSLERIHPSYLTDFRLLKCPNLPVEMSAGIDQTDYGYLYKMGPVRIPENEAPKGGLLSWEEAYEKRGERLPLVDCRFHGTDLNNTPVGDKSLITKLVLRMDGSVSKSIKGIPHDGTSLSWYDF
jgi:prepilin-type N-terminal cleavage/methylation domain-containing protein